VVATLPDSNKTLPLAILVIIVGILLTTWFVSTAAEHQANMRYEDTCVKQNGYVSNDYFGKVCRRKPTIPRESDIVFVKEPN